MYVDKSLSMEIKLKNSVHRKYRGFDIFYVLQESKIDANYIARNSHLEARNYCFAYQSILRVNFQDSYINSSSSVNYNLDLKFCSV